MANKISTNVTRKMLDESNCYGNDELTKAEFTTIIQKLQRVVDGPLLKKDDLESLFDLMDENSDKKISKYEFEVLMSKIVEMVEGQDKCAYGKIICYGEQQ